MAAYYVWSGAVGAGTGADWANAFTTLTTAFVTEVAGDTLYVAHDHVEASATTLTLTSSGTNALLTKVVCVNRAGSVPPVSADRRATAQVTTTGNITINLNGFTHYDGVIFIAGNSTGIAHINVQNTANASARFDNCSFRLGSTGTTSRISVLSANAAYIEWNNTTVSFAAVGQGISCGVNILRWRNTLSALLGTMPTTLFYPGNGGTVECIGVDFSAAGAGKTICGTLATFGPLMFQFLDCKLNAAVTKSAVPAAVASNEVDFTRSGAAGVNYTVHRHRVSGLLTEEITIVRAGGASDGTTPIAWKIVTTANCNYSLPFECPPIAIWNDTVGSPVTATVEGIGAALPTDQECWLDLEYLGDASTPQGSFVNDGMLDLLMAPANQAMSSATWGGSTTAFKLAVTFTPQQKGWVYARVKCAKASSTFYIDPLVTLT